MLTPDKWQEISPYLDHALSLPDDECAAWLASVRQERPELGTVLQTLLGRYRVLAQEKFFEPAHVVLPEPRELASQKLGAYTLITQIGQGGMGSVWLAERSDGRFERRVAVKFLNIALTGSAGEQRFKREGSILARLAHPHIAELIDAGVSAAAQPYLILEHVEGEHIDRYCDQHTLDLRARIRLFLDVLAAVAHAHSNLIVHLDIKPPNVLVRNDGEVKLLDFGISKLLEDDGETRATTLTAESGPAMTPEYAAPEQLRGGAITTATDVYSLGVVLYVLLTGRHPAGTGPHSPANLIKAIVDTEAPRLSEVVGSAHANPDVAVANAAKRGATPDKLRRLLRGDLDTVVAKALKKNPVERYASVTALADDLARYLRNEPINAGRFTVVYRAAKFVRRHRASVAFTSLAVMAVTASLIAALIQVGIARSQRDFAFQQILRSEIVNDFDSFLLSDAAPSGKKLSVNELLRRAENLLAHQGQGDLVNRVELMISIGNQYALQDEARSARRLLEEAYRLSRALPDPSIRARASCVLAASLARDEELPRAEMLFQSGLRGLPAEPQFALDRIGCLQSGIEVAEERGDIKESIARAETAQRVLRQSPFDYDVFELGRWTDLAKVYSDAGRNADAVSAFQKAAVLLSSSGRDVTGTAVSFFNNWALELHQLGQPLAAEVLYRRAIDLSRDNQTEDEVSPMVLNNYARTLRELERIGEAEDYANRAYAKAKLVGHQLAINQSLLMRAGISITKHKPDQAAALLAEVESRLLPNLPPGHYAFATIADAKASVSLARGSVADALKQQDQAVSIDEAAIKSGGEGLFLLPTLLIHRSAIALKAGRPGQAIADAERALGELQKSVPAGTLSSVKGRGYLALGHALYAEGKHAEACAAATSALEHLQPTLGSTHPDTRDAQMLLAGDTQNR